jgi:hypothetical protein
MAKIKLFNLKEMLDKGFNSEYEYQDHVWVNQQKNCGCIIAICVDIDISNDESQEFSKLLTKKSVLQTYINNSASILDKDSKEAELEKFKEDYLKTQLELNDLIKQKRSQYDLPIDADCNGEYYFVKIKQDPSCRG